MNETTTDGRGTVTVLERYRDSSGYWREHYACQACGKLVHGYRGGEAGAVHDCVADVVLVQLAAGPRRSAHIPFGTRVHCLQVGHGSGEHRVSSDCLGLSVAVPVEWTPVDDPRDVVATSDGFAAGGSAPVGDGRHLVILAGTSYAYTVEVAGGLVELVQDAAPVDVCRLDSCNTCGATA